MSIANKLTYLNTTKGKIKDSINLTGAGITNEDTFRSYAVKLRDGLVNVLNNGTIVLYNNFPKVSGTGSNISLSNTLEAPMFMNKFDGDTLQDGEPTPDTPVEIQSVEGIQNVNVCGKNLFDGVFELGSIDNSTGSNVYDNQAIRSKNYIKVSPNTTYTVSTENNCSIFVHFYSEDKTYLSYNNVQNTPKTFTTPNNCEYVRLRTRQAENITDLSLKCQLEKGSTSTAYEPYQSQTQEVNLGNIKLYNGDYITGTPDNWSIYRENGVIVLNGTESMGYNSSSEWLYVGISQFTSNYKVELMKSNYFTYVANMEDTSVEGFGINNALAPTHFVFRNLQLTSKNDWITWLSTHNTEVVYELATPTTEQITDTYLISQLNALYNAKSCNGQTNISVSGNLPMILEVSALKDEI